jgi:heme/copper-type cytochrome/quinol oxidase subunit 2
VTSRSFHHRLALAGQVLVAFATGLYSVLGVLAGDPSAPLFAPATVGLIAVTVLVHRTHKALWLLALGWPIYFVISALDPFRLLHLDSFVDFGPAVLALGGAGLAWVSSIVAIVRYRRGTDPAAPRAERAAIVVYGLVLAGVCVYSLGLTLSRASRVTLPDGRDAVVLTTAEDRWLPRTFTVPAGAGTLVLVRNPDWIAHTFAVAELGIDVYVAPRAERVVEIAPPSAKTYAFECSVTGHERMNGTLRAS